VRVNDIAEVVKVEQLQKCCHVWYVSGVSKVFDASVVLPEASEVIVVGWLEERNVEVLYYS